VTEPETPAPVTAAPKTFYNGLFDREEADTSTPVTRRVLGVLLLLVGLGLFVLYVMGTLDTTQNVFLKSHFGAPTSGVFVLLAFILLAYFVGYPVKATVEQRRRSRIRTVIIVLAGIALIVAVFIHALGLYKYAPKVVATSPSGTRQAALIAEYDSISLRIFEGKGLSRHEVGSVGTICGREETDRIVFASDDSLKVSTPYNDFVIPLDPNTGVPLKHFGPRCDSPAQ
jgi:hypothetical protein